MRVASARARFWFDHTEAQAVLATFAGAWSSLGADRAGRQVYRNLYRGVPVTGEVFTFRSVEVSPGSSVVLDVTASPGPT